MNAPSEFLDYGPDAVLMAGLNGAASEPLGFLAVDSVGNRTQPRTAR